MTQWPSTKAKKVLRALESIGWRVVRQRGSHRIMAKQGCPDFTFAFHDKEEIGPHMLARIAKYTDLTPNDL
jgi:predicted RNA binding protein YcfA (HicA-like mRNA interferase family)